MIENALEISCEPVTQNELEDLYKNESIQEHDSDAGLREDSSIIYSEYDRSLAEADKDDYKIAVASGLLSATVDILWTGKTSLLEAREWGNNVVNDIVIKLAHNRGFKGKDLQKAILFLEKNN